MVIDKCDSTMGYDEDHDYQPPCRNNTVDASKVVWEALANQDVKCLSAISETSWLWHRRLGHMHMEHLKDISSKELVRGLPKIKFKKDKIKQSNDGIFINQAKYTKELLKRFDMEASNAFDTPMSSSLKLDKDE
ncbi:hypothetical protein RJ640_015120 [Escallonia rubra]|uniref:GAG-pre-integrase domain-containing protein n=1 Tax=Escallonia rubra TaxID=112253 RepID=A0AA88RET5_9ASTE|nr:hypothetical protein RJ640_015120 [Escallonia rubra]